jgi:hypothetical protein
MAANKHDKIRGSCLCGAVAFEFSNPREFRNCHCSRCRRSRGAAFASNMFVQPADFRWLKGEDQVVTYKHPGTKRFGNSFCRTCGSAAPRFIDALSAFLIPAGSLDTDPGIRPAYHIFVGSKAPWHEIADALPQHHEYPPQK